MRNYDKYVALMGKIADLSHATGLMHWDTEIYLPKGASAMRSRQIATLSGIVHEQFTGTEMGRLLDTLVGDESLSPEEARNVELTKRDFDKEVKLSKDFVEKLSAAQSKAFVNWVKARKADDFAIFKDSLSHVVTLRREEASIRGIVDEPYDTLLDLYEPGLTTAELEPVFREARDGIVPLIRQISEHEQPDKTFLHTHYGKDAQWDFGIDILKAMGYDFDRGRQDVSAHPFTIKLSPTDVRVTTRIDENDFLNMTWSCIHEGGHALYEQGLPQDQYGLPLGQSASLAIHESLSRLWENHIGRSKVFWSHWLPKLKERFPDNLKGIDLDTFYRGINTIAPNLIRTEADELHYHLHVIIRYEIERACINGDLEVRDIAETWNRKYKEYMNVDVPSAADGVLQDVHWSHASFGYFPTYTLGSFYAAQFFSAAQSQLPDLESGVRAGDTGQLLKWLRENIHVHGRMYDPKDLCIRISGKPLDVRDYLNYARSKFSRIYALESQGISAN